MEITFPVEFLVAETPVSLQTKRRQSLEQWKGRIVAASRAVLPEGHFASNAAISATLSYFPETEMAGDIDNIVKPILDALGRHIYVDDRQVHRVLVQKFEPGASSPFAYQVLRWKRRCCGRSRFFTFDCRTTPSRIWPNDVC